MPREAKKTVVGWTHQQLCDLAVVWLKRPIGRDGPGCTVAVSEVRAIWNGQIPDALGLRPVYTDEASVLVEVKVSLADFRADRLKPHHADGQGMGTYRYFFAPEGVIPVDELPARWGLVEVTPQGRIAVRCGHVLCKRSDQSVWRHARAVENEWVLLSRVLERVGDVEVLHKELKRVNRERDRLAAQCDQLNSRLRTYQLAAVADEGQAQVALPRGNRKQ